MPVRFQVDGDFYDHPKSIGLSDAAVALWTRAGSYSAAKLTDGFIAENVLALLTRSPEDAPVELVARGLWKRTKGGFRFHEWDRRNLTKARVEADRDDARNRKRRQRNKGSETEKPQVKTEIVPPGVTEGVTRDKDVSHSDVTDLSVSVSVSNKNTAPSGFAEFWKTYPKKAAKPAAEKAWKKAIKEGADPAFLVLIAGRYAARMADTDPKFICHPTTWLNQARYNDEPEPETAPVSRRHVPLEVPDHIDPDDGPAWAAWLREESQ